MTFEPVNGIARAQQLVNYCVARNKDFGDILTYGEIATAVGLPPDTPNLNLAVSAVVASFKPKFEKQCSRTVTSVWRVGYQIIEARDHVTVAKRHRLRAVRQAKRSLQVLESTDVSALTAVEKDLKDKHELATRSMAAHIEGYDRRNSSMGQWLKT